VPLACGIYWERATTQGATLSALAGLAVWGICELQFPEAVVPPQMVGLFASLAGMLVGSFAPQVIRDARTGRRAAV
jgi:Na+/proline symporter